VKKDARCKKRFKTRKPLQQMRRACRKNDEKFPHPNFYNTKNTIIIKAMQIIIEELRWLWKWGKRPRKL